MKPRVELIYDSDCPNVGQARELLLKAFSTINEKASWRELDRGAVDCPEYARKYGSPTILVDNADVAEVDGNDAACCRLYLHDRGYKGVPELDQVVQALKKSRYSGFSWSRFAASLPSLVAILPVLHCPACWPGYAGILSALGLGFLSDEAYLLPLTCAMLAVAIFALGFKAQSRHGYPPLAMGMISASAILGGKFWLVNDAVLFVGLALLVVASIWNAWPRKKVCCEKN